MVCKAGEPALAFRSPAKPLDRLGCASTGTAERALIAIDPAKATGSGNLPSATRAKALQRVVHRLDQRIIRQQARL